ncbi:MAG: LysM peptidoglycan-binding domain-containing protein [Burkholderiales bacterium]
MSDLQDNAPDRYVVVPGDTLWGIAGRYLKSPWKWPELWQANKDQVRNPNLIYPGEVLVLDRSGGNVSLRVENTVSLSPQVRAEALQPQPIPTIPLTAIGPFLSQPRVVGEDTLAAAPVVVALQENRLAVGAGSLVYAKSLAPNIDFWQLLRRDQKLVDPDSKETLGWLATYLGDARVKQRGDVSTLEMTTNLKQEVYFGDALVPAPRQELAENFYPRAPTKPINGKVIHTYGDLYETGSLRIIALSKGARDGLEVGHVLALRRNQATRNTLRQAPLYGRLGPTGDPAVSPYKQLPLRDRTAPLYGYYGPAGSEYKNPAVTIPVDELPDFRYGLAMVFRVFDRTSFALVMQSDSQVDLYDIVTNP